MFVRPWENTETGHAPERPTTRTVSSALVLVCVETIRLLLSGVADVVDLNNLIGNPEPTVSAKGFEVGITETVFNTETLSDPYVKERMSRSVAVTPMGHPPEYPTILTVSCPAAPAVVGSPAVNARIPKLVAVTPTAHPPE
jgi:hypothetical protein